MSDQVQDAPDWVAERATTGNMDSVFDTLCELVKRDVESANRELGTDWRIETSTVPRNIAVVRRTMYGDEWALFEKNGAVIDVQVRSPKFLNSIDDDFTVRCEWDDDQLQNRVMVADENEPVEPWQISKRALARLFFR